MKKKLWIVSGILCILGALFLAVSLFLGKATELKQQQQYEKLDEASENQGGESETVGKGLLEEKYQALEEKYQIKIPRKELDFEELRQTLNEDIYAWIHVPETVIDYPIVQHPNDDSYYLNHNLDGSSGYPGCIYTESYNKQDFSDAHTVLYGHNMKNGTMFGSLHQYEDSSFFEEQPFFYIYTENDIFVYQIFRAYSYPDEHLLLNYTVNVQTGFEYYLDIVREYKTLVNNVNDTLLAELKGTDKICTLSTCIKNRDDLRYLVQGVLCNAE